jgi:hypothetical protein
VEEIDYDRMESIGSFVGRGCGKRAIYVCEWGVCVRNSELRAEGAPAATTPAPTGGGTASDPFPPPNGCPGTATSLITDAQVAEIVALKADEVRHCYDTGVANGAALSGEISLRALVGCDGAVTRVAVEGDTVGDGATMACLIRSAQGLIFPEPGPIEMSVRIRYRMPPTEGSTFAEAL